MSAASPGPKNAITDVEGILVGNASDPRIKTGVTVIKPIAPCITAVDIRGGGPGTRETDALRLENLVEAINALVLSGGSVFGLAAADEITTLLGRAGKGYSLFPGSDAPVSPIVPAAILYDLVNGGDKNWGDEPPYRALARAAWDTLSTDIALGPIGAGTGAMAGAYPGGLGTASYITEQGWQIGALAAVNPFGSVYMPDSNCFWAAPFEQEGEFGGRGVSPLSASDFPPDSKIGQANAAHAQHRENTTLCVIAVNTRLSQSQAQRLAIMAQDGLARAIRPVHSATDGDVVFAMATGAKELGGPAPLALARLGTLAADCLSRAIARGVYASEKASPSA
ncbi:MAG: P1 family peptidase [bacterium]